VAYQTDRIRLCRSAAAAVILAIALLSQSVGAMQATGLSSNQREASIRSLLKFCIGPTVVQQPVAVTCTEERDPWGTRSQVEAELRRYENRPDHPKRGLLRYQLSMFDQPKRELMYCLTPDGDWLFESYGVRYAQAGNFRWMLSKPEGGQLTIIKAGVPYPSGYNIGQLKQGMLRLHRRLFHAGFGERITGSDISILNASATRWSAKVSVSDGHRSEIALVDGKWAGSRPVISVVRSESGETPILFEQIEFDSHDSNTDLSSFSYATGCRSEDESSESSVVFVTTRAESPSDDEAVALVSVPDLESAATVKDFRDPKSPSFDSYTDAALTSWDKKKGADVYETSRLVSGSASPAASVTPARRNNKWVAIALTAVVLIAGVVLYIRSR